MQHAIDYTVHQLPLDLIDPPSEPHRLSMDEQALRELADSIKVEGLRQPITVRPRDGGRYEIVAGHRRYTAHRMLRADTIAAYVRDAGKTNAEVERFTENLQREQLSPMEEALALNRYKDASGLTNDSIAVALGKSETWVTQRLTLLMLAPELQEALHERHIAISAAVALNTIGDAQHRQYLLHYAISSGASASIMRQWVAEWHAHHAANPDEPAPAPIMPAAGGQAIVQLPCFACDAPTDHTRMVIVRLCESCFSQLSNTNQPMGNA